MWFRLWRCWPKLCILAATATLYCWVPNKNDGIIHLVPFTAITVTDDLVLESVNEDTIKELLQNSRTTSRMASRASLHSAAAMPHTTSSRPASRSLGPQPREFLDSGDAVQNPFSQEPESRRPFLPKIDPKGTMSTQKISGGTGLNNEEATYNRPPSGSARGSAITIHNSFSGTSVATSGSFELGPDLSDSAAPTPHPPSECRKSSGGRSGRTMSPFTKTMTDKDCND